MSESFQPDLDFDAARGAVETGEALIVDLDGYEGPLDVLLALARSQKVDLLQISMAKLADQYLAFVREARRLRFSLAADYLVMAAWLAWLKSRLLLPQARARQGRASWAPTRRRSSWPSASPSSTPCARPPRRCWPARCWAATSSCAAIRRRRASSRPAASPATSTS